AFSPAGRSSFSLPVAKPPPPLRPGRAERQYQTGKALRFRANAGGGRWAWKNCLSLYGSIEANPPAMQEGIRQRVPLQIPNSSAISSARWHFTYVLGAVLAVVLAVSGAIRAAQGLDRQFLSPYTDASFEYTCV